VKFQPGQSGNPGGRKPMSKEIRETLRGFTDKAVARLGKLIDHKNPRVALLAIQTLFDRAYGKAMTLAEISIEDNRSNLGEMIPLTPAEVAVLIAELLTTAEKEMGLEPLPNYSSQQRVERLLQQPVLSPSLYQALHSVGGTRH
jgi:hypothetical protein